MADTRRLDVVQGIETRLKAVGKPASLNVDRKEYRPIEASGLPRAVPYMAPRPRSMAGAIETVDDRATLLVDRFLECLVEVQVEFDPATESPDEVADPFLSWCEKTLREDETLGGVADQIQTIELVAKEVEEKGKAFARYALRVVVQYQSLRTNPEALS